MQLRWSPPKFRGYVWADRDPFANPRKLWKTRRVTAANRGDIQGDCNGRALDRVTKEEHRPNRRAKNCPKEGPKIVFSARPLFWTIFGHFSDIFWTFFDILGTFCRHSDFLGCPTICPLQFKETRIEYPGSAVPKRGRPKRGRTRKHANDCKRAQMSANARPQKSVKESKRAQKSASKKK